MRGNALRNRGNNRVTAGKAAAAAMHSGTCVEQAAAAAKGASDQAVVSAKETRSPKKRRSSSSMPTPSSSPSSARRVVRRQPPPSKDGTTSAYFPTTNPFSAATSSPSQASKIAASALFYGFRPPSSSAGTGIPSSFSPRRQKQKSRALPQAEEQSADGDADLTPKQARLAPVPASPSASVTKVAPSGSPTRALPGSSARALTSAAAHDAALAKRGKTSLKGLNDDPPGKTSEQLKGKSGGKGKAKAVALPPPSPAASSASADVSPRKAAAISELCAFCFGTKLANKTTGKAEDLISCAKCGSSGELKSADVLANALVLMLSFPSLRIPIRPSNMHALAQTARNAQESHDALVRLAVHRVQRMRSMPRKGR
mgnify:FL=1